MWTNQEDGVSIDQRNPHRYPMALHTSAVLRCPFLRSFPMRNISRIGYAAMGMSSKNNSHRSNSRSVKSFAGTYTRNTVIPMTMGGRVRMHDQMKDSGASSLFIGCACSHDSKPSIIPPRSA